MLGNIRSLYPLLQALVVITISQAVALLVQSLNCFKKLD